MRFNLGANSDIGNTRRLQEDYVNYKEFGNDIFAIIADGTGTSDDRIQPAVTIINSMINEISDIKNENDALFNSDPLFFIRRAMLNANSIIGVMKMSNGEIYYAHSGNTRIYLLRDTKLNILTEDHTVAMQRVNEGELSMDHYYITDDRLKVTSGIGLSTEPVIYVNQGRIKVNDILVLTTDGIHYALTPENMVDVILNSQDVVDASEKLVYASKNFVNYPDNMTAMLIGITE